MNSKKHGVKMKIDRKKLVDCLRKLSSVLVSNPLVPEYGCFQIQNNMVWATDGEMVIFSFLPMDIGIQCSVPGMPFLHLIEGLKKTTVDIVRDGNQLNVLSNTGKIKATFAIFDVIERPEISVTSWVDMTVTEISSFVKGAGLCRFAASKDRTAGPICGVRLQEDRMISCNRYRVLRLCFSKSFPEMVGTLPLKFIKILVKYKEEIKRIACIEDSMFVAEFKDNTLIKTSLISGEYRDVEQYFPCTETFQEIEFGEDFGEVLDRHIEFLQEIRSLDKEIEIDIQKDVCIFTSKEKELGILREEISLAFPNSQGIKFVINPLLLKDVVKLCPVFKYFPDKELILFEKKNLSCIIRVTTI